MKINKTNFSFLLISLIAISCAGPGATNSGSTEERESKDIPDWFLNPPTAEGYLYGVGEAKKQNPTLATKTATSRARAEISEIVRVKVSSMLKDFMQESGAGGNASALEFSEAVTKQVSDNTLIGSSIKESYVAEDGAIYILVEYPMNNIKDDVLGAAKGKEALYNEFKANQSFEALEEAIKKID